MSINPNHPPDTRPGTGCGFAVMVVVGIGIMILSAILAIADIIYYFTI